MKKALQRRLAKLFANPRVERFQTQRRRRLLSVVLLAWLLLMAFCLTLIPKDLVWPALVCGVGMIYLMSMHNLATRGIFELADEYLDEYQIQSRNSAYKMSFGYSLLWILFLGIGFLGVEQTKDNRFVFLAMMFFAFTSGLSAPRIVYAWLAEDESEEELNHGT